MGGVVRPFALCTLGNVRERGGDEAGRDLALYAEAEGLYLAAHLAGSKDAATAECYMRVQAKRSEAVEFTLLPARIGVDVVMGVVLTPQPQVVTNFLLSMTHTEPPTSKEVSTLCVLPASVVPLKASHRSR